MKYAKWKAVELSKCLKSGIAPTPGPPGGVDEEQGDVGYFPSPASGPADATTSYGVKPVPKPRHNVPQEPQAPTGYVPDPNPSSYAPSNVGFRYDNGEETVPPPRSTNPSASVGASGGVASGGVASGPATAIGPEGMAKAQKLCRYASSSLDYEDTAGAVEYLQKALHLLTTGKEL